jgi:hypothetical protein
MFPQSPNHGLAGLLSQVLGQHRIIAGELSGSFLDKSFHLGKAQQLPLFSLLVGASRKSVFDKLHHSLELWQHSRLS